MPSFEYTEVPAIAKDELPDKIKEEKSWKPLLRQLFISSGLWTHYFSAGISQGTPTVFIPQMRKEGNSTDAVTVEMASWLSSAFAYSTVPPIIVLALLIPHVSRKKICILISTSMILVSFGYYFTTSPVHLLITDLIQGVSSTGAFTIAIICLVEYTSPRYRGVILTVKTANVFWAIWIANAIGTFTHWRYICVPSFINSIYSLTVFFWPESPTWLASKGRIDECKKVHRWLKGRSGDSERELEAMLASQMAERKRRQEHSRSFLGVLTDRQFYVPVVLSCLMMGVHLLSGKQVCIIYALDMLKKITKSESTAYAGMLILDGVTVLCMYLGCGLSKFLKRRTLLFLFGSIGAVFLFATSLYLYLCHLSILIENDYISISLLVGFSVAIGVGPLILATALYGEIIPVKYNREAVTLIAVVFFLLQGTLFKLSPYIFKTFEMHGTFLLYGLSVTIGLIILYKYLPETKDKTIQEIEEYFK